MKKIAIDIDDVITNTSDLLFEYLNDFKKVDLNNPENNKIDIMRGKITCPELLEFYNEYAVKIAKNVTLKPGTKKGLEFLKSCSFEIHILSARIADTLDTTIEYFNKNELYYDYLKVGKLDKKTYCKENEIDFLIDDSYEACKIIQDSNTTPILFTSFINENIDSKDIIRLNSWNNIESILDL